MTFFQPPKPRRRSRSRRPSWSGPPDGELGSVVATQVILVHRGDLVVAVTHLTAYRHGFELCLSARARGHDLYGQLPPHHRETSYEEALWFGVAFSDGRHATNLEFGSPAEKVGPAGGPVLWPGGGSGGESRYDQNYWVWPLPPPGPLTFVSAWRSCGIDETRQTIDAQLLLDASAHSQVLWDEPPTRTGGTSCTSTQSVGTDDA